MAEKESKGLFSFLKKNDDYEDEFNDQFLEGWLRYYGYRYSKMV